MSAEVDAVTVDKTADEYRLNVNEYQSDNLKLKLD